VSLKAFFQTVVEILDRADVPYMLTGSLAAAYYAVPRATQDLDVVIEAERSGIERVVHGLRIAGLYVEQEAALEAQKVQGQFNAIDPSSGWKVDLIVRKDREYSQVEFGRRRQVRLLDVEVSIASLEDVLISKLEWSEIGGSALQRADVLQLLQRRWGEIDHSYVETWVATLGLQDAWDKVCREVAPDRDGGPG
jgi:hypothetical protein